MARKKESNEPIDATKAPGIRLDDAQPIEFVIDEDDAGFDAEIDAEIDPDADPDPAPKPTTRRGPKLKEPDQNAFEELCKIQCTEKEICAVFGITDKTLSGWCRRTYGKKFSDVYAEKREGGKASLRRMQWQQAEKNPTMAIWLGKNVLDQSDDPQKAARERATGDKLDELLEALTDAVAASGDD